jgi:Family of unknown function (DUF6152)
MTKSKFTVALGVLVAAFGVQSAFAHHSFEGVYDGSRTVDVEGVVKAFRLVNPHATMTLEVTNDKGRKELRTVEFDGRLNLTVGGWTPEIIRPGEHVTVHGNPARAGNGRVWFLSLTRADGTKLIRPFNARTNAIDEQRRQRAQQRDSQK